MSSMPMTKMEVPLIEATHKCIGRTLGFRDNNNVDPVAV